MEILIELNIYRVSHKKLGIVFRAHFRGYNGLKSIKKKLEIRKYPLKIQFYFNKILISLM